MPCAGNEPGSLILSGSDRSNHCSRMPALPRSNWNRHWPASEMRSDGAAVARLQEEPMNAAETTSSSARRTAAALSSASV